MNTSTIRGLGIASIASWVALALSACGGLSDTEEVGVVTAAQTLNAPFDLTGTYNESLWSDNGQYRLTMQSDCNLVLYEVNGAGWRAVWASNTNGRATNCRAVMQTDGNLVIYSGTKVIWSPNTWGHPGAYLVMQDDRNAVIYDAQRRALWSTDTWIRPPSGCVDAPVAAGCRLAYPSCYALTCNGQTLYYNCGTCR